MDEAKVRELLSHTARVCPQSRSASCPCLPLTCAPAPNIRVDVGDPLAVHRRLLTHRLAFCEQVKSGGRRRCVRGDNDTDRRQRQGSAARGSPRAAWVRGAVDSRLTWQIRAAAGHSASRPRFAGTAQMSAAACCCPPQTCDRCPWPYASVLFLPRACAKLW